MAYGLRARRDAVAAARDASPRRYSLQWFQALFVAAISKAEKAETLEARLDVLNTFFTYYVYVNVCRCRRGVCELQARVDGVGETSRHRDAVDGAVRESREEPWQFRECRSTQVPTSR